MKRLFCLLVLLAPVATVQAAPITWAVTGTITALVDPLAAAPFGDALLPGQAFTWTLDLDDATPNMGSASCAVFRPVSSMTFTAGSLAVSTSGPGQDFIVNTGTSSCDVPTDLTRLRAGFDDGLVFTLHLFGLTDPAVPASIDGLSVVALDILLGAPAPNGRELAYVRAGGAVVTQLGHQAASVPAVPEPSLLGLLGLSWLAWRRRIR